MIRFAALLLATVAVPVAAYSITVDHHGEATDDASRLNAWFDEKFEEELAFSPIRQTALGRRIDYDKIDDFSDEAAAEQIQWRRDAVAEMKANFDYDMLPADAQLSWEMFEWRLKQAERDYTARDQMYVLHQMNGTHTQLPSFLISQHAVETEADLVAFNKRISAIGRAIDQLRERAMAAAERGVRPPRFAYDAVIAESEKLTDGGPFAGDGENAVWDALKGHLATLVANGTITQARADELEFDAQGRMRHDFGRAYVQLATWFRNDRPNADEVARGVHHLEGGADYYQNRLAAMTTTDLTADEIHAIGLSEVARIRGEMEAIKEQVGFEGDLDAFFTFMREDDRFYFSNDDEGAQDYIEAAEKHLEFINTRLPEFFGTLPKADLVVKRVEPFREQDGAAQHYRPGTPDGSRPGIYYAHLSDMRAMPIPPLEVIAYHEGNPGHHMQNSIAQELEGVPNFRSQGQYISAFGEGWALYSELLAKEMGAYEDPYSDFGRLTTEMWRAIRLVVDTGIHSKGWGEEEAINYFLANSPMPETTVRSEVRRYIVWPGQATSYKIGMIRIQELRAMAEEELGDKFDIREFHDTVLESGPVPLGIMEKRVRQWVDLRLAD